MHIGTGTATCVGRHWLAAMQRSTDVGPSAPDASLPACLPATRVACLLLLLLLLLQLQHARSQSAVYERPGLLVWRAGAWKRAPATCASRRAMYLRRTP